MINKEKLKGGSLSGTYLITTNENNKFIRKEVSLVENREYGFQRWYSQLKRIQRYSVLFPTIFPNLLNYGHEGDTAYFDIEYIENTTTAHKFLTTVSDNGAIYNFSNALIRTMDVMHKVKMTSSKDAIFLYIREEVEKRLNDCLLDKDFYNFACYENIYFNGEKVPSFMKKLDDFKKSFSGYSDLTEVFTHGNLTLENILYSQEKNKIIFIDPYEENIIDSVLAEYSQIYQSSNSKYELYNDASVKIKDNFVEAEIPTHAGLDYFNDIFTKYVNNNCTSYQFKTIKLLEISQFIRMLPFKMAVDKDKMFLFYALASKLFNNLQEII